MRNRGLLLLALLAAFLFFVLMLWGTGNPPAQQAEPDAQSDAVQAQALLDAMMDRIGATRWAEAIEWYAMQEEGTLDALTVWVSRTGQGAFHSVPICAGMKAPVQMRLEEALQEARTPCPICWEIDSDDHSATKGDS